MKPLTLPATSTAAPLAGSLLAALILAPGAGWSQDALHSAVEGDRNYRTRTAPLQRPEDYHTAGSLTYFTSLSYGVEWRDNILNTSTDEKSDFIHRPRFDVHALWKVTKDSKLEFGTGIGYTKYTRYTDNDRLSITPNSEIAWDLPVKDFVFTLYDRISYVDDVVSQSSITGVAAFPRLDNTIGLRAMWNPDRYRLQAGYGHQTYHSSSANFSYLNRSTENFFARAAYRFKPSTLAGIETSVGITDYAESIQPNNTSVSVGPFTEWQLTRSVALALRGGVVLYSFDALPGSTTGSSDLTSYYVGAEVTHQLTRSVRHGLTADRQVRQGLNQGGQYIESLDFKYDLRWTLNRRISLIADALFEDGREPQAGATEDYQRLGGGLGMRYRLTRHISPYLRYSHTRRESSIAGRDYQSNTVLLSAEYRF